MECYTLSGNLLTVSIDGRRLEFQRVGLVFLDHGITDVFGRKNNKTVKQTLTQKRYVKLADVIVRQFPNGMAEPLGDFLLKLKQSGDLMYTRFLNPYGDGVYCRFRMERGPFSVKKGL